MKKAKRFLALVGVVLLVAMYASTLVFALMKNENSKNMLMASIVCTILIPVLLYAFTLMYRVLGNKNDPASKTDEGESKKN